MEIREMDPNDLEQYERLLPEDVLENIFRSHFHGIAALGPILGDPVGTIVWKGDAEADESPDTVELIWMNASDGYTAKDLFAALVRRLKRGRVKNVSFVCPPERGQMAGLLEEMGFAVTKKPARRMAFFVSDFTSLPLAKKEPPRSACSISNLTSAQFSAALDYCMKKKKTGHIPDMESLPFDWYEPRLSCCVTENGLVNGLLLLHRGESGTLMPVLLYAWGKNTERKLLSMFRYAIREASAYHSGETPVVVEARTQEAVALVAKLFPKHKPEEALTGKIRLF